MNTRLIALGVALAFVATVEFFALRAAKSSLQAEKAAHAVTVKERDTWKAEAEAALSRAGALADTARACLARETKARADAAERATIMSEARPRPRMEQEKARVVDNETRKRVTARLNRPL